MSDVRRVKGTRDLLPPETAVWAAVEETARRVFGLYGYQEIRTPLLEPTELFVRSVGEATDIVGKEMYTFPDRKGRSLTLRPESTASVARAFVENGLHAGPLPARLWYAGPQFRYEQPERQLGGLVGQIESGKFAAQVPEHARFGHVDGGDRHLELLGDARCRLVLHGRQPKCAPRAFGKIGLHQRDRPARQLGLPLLAAAIIWLAWYFVWKALKAEVRSGAARGSGLFGASAKMIGRRNMRAVGCRINLLDLI